MHCIAKSLWTDGCIDTTIFHKYLKTKLLSNYIEIKRLHKTIKVINFIECSTPMTFISHYQTLFFRCYITCKLLQYLSILVVLTIATKNVLDHTFTHFIKITIGSVFIDCEYCSYNRRFMSLKSGLLRSGCFVFFVRLGSLPLTVDLLE